MTSQELVREFRQLVTDAATPKGYGWCGGQREKAAEHVAHILPVVARLLAMSEAEFAEFAMERRNGRFITINGVKI